MEFIKINNVDFSNYCSALKVSDSANYNAQTNAAGDTKVDFLNTKKQIEVTIIPLTEDNLSTLLTSVSFNSIVEFRNPKTKALESANCIIEGTEEDYYTIQDDNVRLNETTLIFKEL